MKNKVIGKRGEPQGYVIRTDSGFIHIDEEGEWWLGGSCSVVGIALFGHRVDAITAAKKIRRQRPDLIKWTQTIHVFSVA